MPLNIQAHGGGCCGIKHLSYFAAFRLGMGQTREEFIQASLNAVILQYGPKKESPWACTCNACMQEYIQAAAALGISLDDYAKIKLEDQEKARGELNLVFQVWSTAVECVLAATQYDDWKVPLENCGFREVFQFRNSNSKNMCHVFYGTTNPGVSKETKVVESAPKDTEIAV